MWTHRMRLSHSAGLSRTSASHREVASALGDSTGVEKACGLAAWVPDSLQRAQCQPCQERLQGEVLPHLQRSRRAGGKPPRVWDKQDIRDHTGAWVGGALRPLSCPRDACAEFQHAQAQQRARAPPEFKPFCPNPRRHPECAGLETGPGDTHSTN